MHITRAVKGIIQTTVCHLNQPALDILPFLQVLGRVNEIRRPELLGPFLLRIIHIHDDNLASSILDCTLNNGQTHAAGAENSHRRPFLDPAVASRDDGSAIAGGDTAPQQTGPVHGGLVGDGDDGDVGHDGVLGEGRGAHEVQQPLALALEARGAVGHHAFTLRGADLAAEVRLARLAELAFAAFGGAVELVRAGPSLWPCGWRGFGEVEDVLKRHHSIALLHVRDARAHTLHHTGALVAQHDGERTLRILAGEGVGIGMADTSVVDLDADLMCLRRSDLDVLDAEVLARFPSHGGLAGDGLAFGRHLGSLACLLACWSGV
jgi:hypothetical protein